MRPPGVVLRDELFDGRIGDDGVNQLLEGLADRVRAVREDLYGPDGVERFAQALGLTRESWANYERGMRIPDVVILRLIHLSGATRRWLMTGEGPRYQGQG